jgi:hypothetical protein
MGKVNNGAPTGYAVPIITSIVTSVATAVIIGGGTWLLGIGPQLARIDTTLSSVKTELEKTEGRLSKSIEDTERRLTKTLDEAKAKSDEVQKEITRVDSRVSEIKGEVNALSKIVVSDSAPAIRTWLVAVAPAEPSDEPSVGVYLIDALEGTIKSWDPFPVDLKEQHSRSVIMGKFWGVARGADSASETLDRLMTSEEKTELGALLWTGCSFGMSLAIDDISGFVTKEFFRGEPKMQQGLGNRPTELSKLSEFIQGNHLVP